MQGNAVVPAPVRADLDQAAQPALQPGQFGQLLADRAQLGLGRALDVVGRAGLRRTEQLGDLTEREPELLGPPDEGQPPEVLL